MILEEIREDGDISSVAYLMDFEINASTMKAKFYGNNEEFDIVKSKMNNRCRCHHSTKGYGEAFNISKIIKKNFPTQQGEYGFKWKKEKNNRV